MANITNIRSDYATGPEPGVIPANSPLAPFRAGRPEEDRLVDLLAYAMATERNAPASPEGVHQLRNAAAAELSSWAVRHLHNRVAEIRQDAVTEHLGNLPRPPGFLKLLSANLVAVVLAGGAAFWLALHPATLAGLAGLVSG